MALNVANGWTSALVVFVRTMTGATPINSNYSNKSQLSVSCVGWVAKPGCHTHARSSGLSRHSFSFPFYYIFWRVRGCLQIYTVP